MGGSKPGRREVAKAYPWLLIPVRARIFHQRSRYRWAREYCNTANDIYPETSPWLQRLKEMGYHRGGDESLPTRRASDRRRAKACRHEDIKATKAKGKRTTGERAKESYRG